MPSASLTAWLSLLAALMIGAGGVGAVFATAQGQAQAIAQQLARRVAPWVEATTPWPERAVAALAPDVATLPGMRGIEIVGAAGGRGQWPAAGHAWTALRASAPVRQAGAEVGEVRVALSMNGLLGPGLAALTMPLLLLLVVRLLERVRVRHLVVQFGRRHKIDQAAANERWRLLFEQGSDALVCCDRHGTVRAANPPAIKLLGRDAARVIGQPLSSLLHGELPNGDEQVVAQIVRETGESISIGLRRSQLDEAGVPLVIWRLVDLTQQRDAAKHLVKLANYDSLTGLPNRELFRDRLHRAMERARRSGAPMALMFLDLDRFKVVNDSLGHAVGDDLLRHVAQTLVSSLRSVDSVLRPPEDEVTISRLGGDEFTVIIENIGGADDAALVARRLLEALAVPFTSGEEEIVVSASLGIALYPTDDVDLDGLLRHADMAMYRSKSLGRNTFSFFSDDLNTAVKARLSLEGSLRRAIERNEFQLYYQPKTNLRTGEVVGMEALLRWHCPGKGMVPPDRFISVLEDTGLILPAGAWVIRTALAELDQWDRAGLPPVNVAVNLSARQLRHQFLTSMIEETLAQFRMAPARLELELTESLLMEDTEMTRAMLANFARIGVRLAIDDFGTGHSSLAYLRRFKVDTLKIDRSFVSETPGDTEACAIAAAVIALGRSMEIKLVAEGVETLEQAVFLRERGCDEIQGYLLTRPLPLPQLIEWYKAYERLRRDRRLPLYGGEPDTLPGGLMSIELADEASEAV